MSMIPDGWIFIPKIEVNYENGCAAANITIEERKLIMCRNCIKSIEPCDGWDRRCKVYGVVRDDFYCGDGKEKE